MRIGILEPANFSEKALVELQRLGEVSLYNNAELEEFVKGEEVLFIRLGYQIDSELLDSAEKLKYICTPTTGLNHIDLNGAEARGIKVLSLRGEQDFLANIRATPEHAFGLVLSLLRNYSNCFLNNNNKEWDRDKYIGSEIHNNKIGIIGLGRVGWILKDYFLQFGAEVFYFDKENRVVNDSRAKNCDSAEHLISQTNIVILAVSYSKENENLIDAQLIDFLKGKYFVNIARGELVDEEYLIKKIAQNYFRGVALDVIANETKANNLNKFIELVPNHNLILTPHVGGATAESMHKTEEFIVGKLRKEIS